MTCGDKQRVFVLVLSCCFQCGGRKRHSVSFVFIFRGTCLQPWRAGLIDTTPTHPPTHLSRVGRGHVVGGQVPPGRTRFR
jgi:hypothetical protein